VRHQQPRRPVGTISPWPTVPQMIRSCTINGAYAYKMENLTGSIEVGKSADMVVLDRNILTCDPAQIGDGKVLLTLFQGKEVFKDASF